ncbi:MAG: PKD domain-containing protein, partial [Flavobacteriia bacterium]
NIGVPFAGTGDILSFATTNGTGASVNSTFTVTPSTGTCIGTPINFDISVEPSVDATFSYAASSFCLTEANPNATVTNPGGVFTSNPAGLNFADATGTIDLVSSVAGNYVVTYSFGGICPTTFDFNVSLGDAPFVTNPGNFTYCENATTTDILFAGGVGSQFTWTSDNTNIGLGANGNGDILSFVTSATGLQQIATIEVVPFVGTCSGSAEIFTITVNPTEDATFSYAQTAFCSSNPNPFPTITGVAGGTFSAVPAGLTLDVNTGEIDIASSAQNTYDITYTTTNPTCPGTFTFQVQIGIGTATVDAVVNQQFCDGSNTTDILFTGSVGANFTWTNDNPAIGIPASGNGDILTFLAANGTTAPIVANITVTPDDGLCPGPSTSFTITVNPVEDASFTLSAINSCSNDLMNAPVTTITGDAGGVFSAGPGLTIDPITGAIDVSSIPGNYLITYTTTGVCPASTSLNFELIQTPVILPFAGVNVCSGTIVPQVDLSVLSTFAVDWTNDNLNTGIPSLTGTGDIPSFLANNPTPGAADEVSVITLTATNNGCTSASQSFNFAVKSLPIVGAGSDRTICEGSVITLTGTGSAASFVWDNGITNAVAFTPVAGNYLYTVTGTTNGCSALDQVTVIVNPAPIVNAGVDVTICVGSQALLTATGATTLSWNNGVNNNVPFIPVIEGNYIVTGVSPNGCTARDTLVLTLEDLPIPSFTSDVNMGCIPADITFTSSNTTNTCIYSFSDGSIENGPNVTHTFTQTGVYDVTLNQISINGCIGSTTVPSMIIINPDPVSSFTVDRPIVNMIDPVTSFENNSQGALTYEWIFGDGSLSDSSFEPAHAFPSDVAGNYSVMLIAVSEFGCKDTSYADVILEESIIFYIPNSFTPNGDELNNKFNPMMYSGFDTQDFNMKIFDRWGELVFETYDALYGWDGDFGAGKGLAPGGTYTYKIVFNTPSKDEKKVIVGNVNLIR